MIAQRSAITLLIIAQEVVAAFLIKRAASTRLNVFLLDFPDTETHFLQLLLDPFLSVLHSFFISILWILAEISTILAAPSMIFVYNTLPPLTITFPCSFRDALT